MTGRLISYNYYYTGQQELDAARATSNDCTASSSANTAQVGGGVVGGFVAGVVITIVLAAIILLIIGWKWYTVINVYRSFT